MTKRQEIIDFLNNRLDVDAIDDASNNGLQVQGTDQIEQIGLATDAAIAVYQKAAEKKCQMLITHHGLIWKGLDAITGRNYEHIKFLLSRDINLYAAHLPLDKHPELGNNAQLAQLIDLQKIKDFGYYHGTPLGFSGTLGTPMSLPTMAAAFQKVIGGRQQTLDFGPREISTVGIVSGGGSSTLPEAIAAGLDCLVTGEGSHENFHLAKEGAINVLYLGHYHSETLGVQALGRELEKNFPVKTIFIDEPTIF